MDVTEHIAVDRIIVRMFPNVLEALVFALILKFPTGIRATECIHE